MAFRRPLVAVDGELAELPTGDSLAGAAMTMPINIGEGLGFTVGENTQALFSEEIQLNGDLTLDGILIEVM